MRTVGAIAFSLLALVLGILGVPAAASAAGTYTVNICAATQSPTGWQPDVRSGEPVEATNGCYTQGATADPAIDSTGAQALRPASPTIGTPATTAAAGRVGGLTLTAAPGTTFTHISYHRKLLSTDPAWDVRLSAGTTVIDRCKAVDAQTPCTDTAPGGVFTDDLPAGTTSLDLAAYCVAAPCTYRSGNSLSFGAAIYSASVTVQALTPPAISSVGVDSTSGGWLTSGSTMTVSATDITGIKELDLMEGGEVIASNQPTCYDSRPQPCVDGAGQTTTLKAVFNASTVRFADGPHTIFARATDAAGNVSDSAPVSFNVDTTPPNPVFQFGGKVQDEQRTISWTVAPGGSPIVYARVEVCLLNLVTEVASGCVKSDAPLAGPFVIDMPDPYSAAEVHVSIADQAGNGGESKALYLDRDALPPAVPKLTPFGASGVTRSFIATTDDESSMYALPTLCKGTSCTTLKPVPVLGPSTNITVTPSGPGDYRVDVAMVDESGNASAPASASFSVAVAANAQLGAGTGSVLGAGGGAAKVITIAPIVPKKLSGSTLLIRGTATPGSASSISISLAGRLKNGKATGAAKSVVPAANGKFAVRLRLPAKLNTSKGVLVTIAATPEAGYAQAKARVRVKG